jgi:hypothetical protein
MYTTRIGVVSAIGYRTDNIAEIIIAKVLVQKLYGVAKIDFILQDIYTNSSACHFLATGVRGSFGAIFELRQKHKDHRSCLIYL